jgi:hypothetical protein
MVGDLKSGKENSESDPKSCSTTVDILQLVIILQLLHDRAEAGARAHARAAEEKEFVLISPVFFA